MAARSDKEFHLGLAMSGAVSAGAYTAGVFDFLVEALDAWEKALAESTDGSVPDHRVGVKVMAGASAGAITAAIGALALIDANQTAVTKKNHKGEDFTVYLLPKLYQSWVEKPRLVEEGLPESFLLKNDDLDSVPTPGTFPENFTRTSGTPAPAPTDAPLITSLLNVTVLAQIARDALNVTAVKTPPRDWVADPLHVYMTMTNMRGTPWRVEFDGGYYHMISHGDRMHCAISGAGGWTTPGSRSEFGENDAPRPVVAADVILRTPDWINTPAWHDFAMGALASSAFPVGLAPRTIYTSLETDYPRLFPSADLVYANVKPDPNWSAAIKAKGTFVFGTADGGVIDNDPFEYAHFAVKAPGNLAGRNTADLAHADRAIIMITPFPEEKPIAPEGAPKLDIVSFTSALLPSLIDQARFKPDALALAAKPDHGSRFLIGPSRSFDGRNYPYAIASGLLGGFGGFISRRFRDHDFRLGRRNCQKFLEDSFVVAADNEIVKGWGPHVDRKKFFAGTMKNSKGIVVDLYRLIPLYGNAAHEVDALDWPRITQSEFDEVQSAIAGRFDYVAPKLLAAQNLNSVLYAALWLSIQPWLSVFSNLPRGAALHLARFSILAELVRRDQIDGWSLAGVDLQGMEEEDARLVVGALLEPAVGALTAAQVEAAIGHAVFYKATVAQIGAFLDGLTGVQGNLQVVAKGAGEDRSYRLAMRMSWWDWVKWQFETLLAKFGL